ncbi:vacuolar sorting protein, partial [Trifolium medium]|nr:vacuolar sorting protein [Trifolium medium]
GGFSPTLPRDMACVVFIEAWEALTLQAGFCVELDRLAVYLDSDIIPWHVDKAWEDLLPSEWFQVCTVDIRVDSEG